MENNGNLVHEIFGDEILPGNDVFNKVILTPRNSEQRIINDQVLNLVPIMPGDREFTYASVDEVASANPADIIHYPLEFLHSLTPKGMPPHILRLRKGTVVMLLRNFNVSKGKD